jgi:hypothetical protein
MEPLSPSRQKAIGLSHFLDMPPTTREEQSRNHCQWPLNRWLRRRFHKKDAVGEEGKQSKEIDESITAAESDEAIESPVKSEEPMVAATEIQDAESCPKQVRDSQCR